MPLVPYNSDSWIDVAGQTHLSANPVMMAIYFGQMCHETGMGTSELFTEYNNLFGMRPSLDRQKFYQGIKVYQGDFGKSEYAIYDTPLLSLQDVLHRNEYFDIHDVEESEDALAFMMAVHRSGYFTADPKEYIKAWLFHIREGYPNMNWPTDEFVNERLSKTYGFGQIGLPILAMMVIGVWYFFFRKK